MAFNISKTEFVLSNPPRKHLGTEPVKYLGFRIDKNFTWKHIDNVAVKLNKANVMLSKIRHFVDKKTLKLMASSFLSHISLVCVQNNCSLVKRLHILLKKSLRLMFFSKQKCSRRFFFSKT